jgi:hypothetical protein
LSGVEGIIGKGSQLLANSTTFTLFEICPAKEARKKLRAVEENS